LSSSPTCPATQSGLSEPCPGDGLTGLSCTLPRGGSKPGPVEDEKGRRYLRLARLALWRPQRERITWLARVTVERDQRVWPRCSASLKCASGDGHQVTYPASWFWRFTGRFFAAHSRPP